MSYSFALVFYNEDFTLECNTRHPLDESLTWISPFSVSGISGEIVFEIVLVTQYNHRVCIKRIALDVSQLVFEQHQPVLKSKIVNNGQTNVGTTNRITIQQQTHIP